MGGLLTAMFAYVVLSGLMPPQAGQDLARLQDGITAGEAALRRLGGEPVWVVRYSEQDESAKELLASAVDSVGVPPCRTRDNEFCYFRARGVNPDVVIRYVEIRPARLPRESPWYGGFVDPSNGAVYDRFGRGYRSNSGHSIRHLAPLTGMNAPASQ
jgi:hypothetical protein